MSNKPRLTGAIFAFFDEALPTDIFEKLLRVAWLATKLSWSLPRGDLLRLLVWAASLSTSMKRSSYTNAVKSLLDQAENNTFCA